MNIRKIQDQLRQIEDLVRSVRAEIDSGMPRAVAKKIPVDDDLEELFEEIAKPAPAAKAKFMPKKGPTKTCSKCGEEHLKWDRDHYEKTSQWRLMDAAGNIHKCKAPGYAVEDTEDGEEPRRIGGRIKNTEWRALLKEVEEQKKAGATQAMAKACVAKAFEKLSIPDETLEKALRRVYKPESVSAPSFAEALKDLK